MPRKLEAGLDGRYLMSRVLITSTMKSEPGTPPMRELDSSFGVPLSAAATCIVGGSAEGRRSGAPVEVAAFAAGVTAVAAPAIATPARNLRRLTSGCGCFRLIKLLPCHARRSAVDAGSTHGAILSARRHAGKLSTRLHGNVHARGGVPMSRRRVHRTLALTLLLLAANASGAEPVEQLFARRTVTIVIGYTAGGSYDLYGRMVARHLGKHIPGQPTVIAQNMPGAGSLKAANYLYELAPKDGTALGMIVESAALEHALANPAVQYDAGKFTYVGRVATSNNIFMQWHTARVQSLDDAKRMETSLAGTGPGSIAETVPRLLNAVIGTKFKLISGYPASSEAMLAMESGEVDGASSSWAAVKVGKQTWLRENKIRIILQTTPERISELPHTPSLGEIGDTPEDKQVFALYASGSAIARSLLGPPGIPAERAQALRTAFQAMAKDPDFVAEIQRLSVELDPMPGEQLERLVAQTLSTPAAVRERAKAAFGR